METENQSISTLTVNHNLSTSVIHTDYLQQPTRQPSPLIMYVVDTTPEGRPFLHVITYLDSGTSTFFTTYKCITSTTREPKPIIVAALSYTVHSLYVTQVHAKCIHEVWG